MIGDFVNAVVGHLRDDDARAGCRGEVDVVDADTEARDDPAACHLGDHVGRNFCVGDEKRVSRSGNSQNRLGRRSGKNFPASFTKD